MKKLLGVIKAVIGQVYVIEADGSQRLVVAGDRIYSGEEMATGSSGVINVSLPNGQTIDIGRKSHWGEHGLQTADHHEATQDIATMQQAIADGAVLTQTLGAMAAGEPAPVRLEGSDHTLVQLGLNGQFIDPAASFGTCGLPHPVGELHEFIGAGRAGALTVPPPSVQITGCASNDGFINNNAINPTVLSGVSNQTHITLMFIDSQKNTFSLGVPVADGDNHISAIEALESKAHITGSVQGEVQEHDVVGVTTQPTW